jgi:hypothetical protein
MGICIDLPWSDHFWITESLELDGIGWTIGGMHGIVNWMELEA